MHKPIVADSLHPAGSAALRWIAGYARREGWWWVSVRGKVIGKVRVWQYCGHFYVGQLLTSRLWDHWGGTVSWWGPVAEDDKTPPEEPPQNDEAERLAGGNL